GAGHAEEERVVLGPRADKAEELAVLHAVDRDRRVGMRLGRRQRAGGRDPRVPSGAGGEPGEEQRGEQRADGLGHGDHPSMVLLSSPRAGARLAKGGRAPSNDSGIPTRARSLPGCRWIWPSARVCGSATTWSIVLIGPLGMPACSSSLAQCARFSVAKMSARIGT